jgi:hypothetical protein
VVEKLISVTTRKQTKNKPALTETYEVKGAFVSLTDVFPLIQRDYGKMDKELSLHVTSDGSGLRNGGKRTTLGISVEPSLSMLGKMQKKLVCSFSRLLFFFFFLSVEIFFLFFFS